MFMKAKRESAWQGVAARRPLRENPRKGVRVLPFLVLACGTMAAALAAAEETPKEELAPKIPEAANEELKFGGNDLAAVIAIDEQGNHKIFRSRKAAEAKEMQFPIPAKELTFMQSFTVFKSNPTCIIVNGYPICW